MPPQGGAEAGLCVSWGGGHRWAGLVGRENQKRRRARKCSLEQGTKVVALHSMNNNSEASDQCVTYTLWCL